MQIIFCAVDEFALNQKIFKVENGEKTLLAEVGFKDLKKLIPQLCHNTDCYEVHLYGAEPFAAGLKNMILESEARTYRQERITVFVNN